MSNIISKSTISISQQTTQQTTCCYCGVGCGVTATIENNRVIAVEGRKDHPANYGRLCVKGAALHQTQGSPDRLLKPRIRGQEASWDEAIDYIAEKFKAIIHEHGPDAVAFYLSGQLLTEDYYVANKLVKGFLGTANVDTNSRLCMASASSAHKRAFGNDAVPGCYEDLELADLLILVGTNMAFAHPVVFQRIAQAKKERPHMKVVVLDPRRTATCDIADIHLPLAPGSDAFFFNGLLADLDKQNAIDRQFVESHTDGFDQALVAAQAQVPNLEETARLCDVKLEQVGEVVRLFRETKKVVTVFSQGINQSTSGVDKGNAIINCHLATGKIGKEGACPFSITGQPNAMGGREVGGLANMLAAHMYFEKQEDIDRVAGYWHAPNMAQKEGLKAVDMFRAVGDGKIKAIWIMATNPVVSMPDADAVKQALAKCDLVVVNEAIADTDTAKVADVLLPATTWSERHGTVTNSERCISVQPSMLPAPGEAKHDWKILSLFAEKMGFGAHFNYSHPVEIFREHAALSALNNDRTRAFDISGLSRLSQQDYDALQPIQWPVNSENPHGRKRLFEDGYFFTENRKAKLIAVTARMPKSLRQAGEVIMNTGRIRDQWHTMSRTGVAPKLLSHTQEPYIDIHPLDAQALDVSGGQLVVLSNLGAEYIGRAKLNDGQRRGEVFVPMHWNEKYASRARADALVSSFADPLCGQPEFKHCPVKIRRHETQWSAWLLSENDFKPQSDYWVKITSDRGYRYRIGNSETLDWDAWLKKQFPSVTDWQVLQDNLRTAYRAVGYAQGRLVVAFSAKAGAFIPDESRWLESQIGLVVNAQARYSVLAGNEGNGAANEGDIICSCFQVGELPIKKAIIAGCKSAEELGKQLKCGTNCGSCIPELNTLISDAVRLVRA